jgi:hypothetical protein
MILILFPVRRLLFDENDMRVQDVLQYTLVMSRKFGVIFDDEVAEQVEQSLDYGDSRSGRIEKLTSVGLEVERQIENIDAQARNSHEMRAVVRQAFYEYQNSVFEKTTDADQADTTEQ